MMHPRGGPWALQGINETPWGSRRGGGTTGDRDGGRGSAAAFPGGPEDQGNVELLNLES